MSDFTEAADTPIEGDAPAAEVEPFDASEYDGYEYSEQAEEGGEAEPAPSSERTYTVTVDGQQLDVPESELLAGYQRQADYTRKTQALASQRKDLQDAQALLNALQRNPHQTLQVLANAYGIQVAGGGGQQAEQEYVSDEDQRFARIESWQAQQEARQREAHIDATIAGLHQRYGDFSDDELFQYAVSKNVMDLETALRAMRYDAQPSTPPKRMEKRSAGAAANGGSRNGAVPQTGDADIQTVRDAWAAAKRQLNAT